MEKFNQLIITEKSDLSFDENIFMNYHKEIIYYGNLASDSAIRMAKKLMEMRDGKYYLSAGFQTFSAYTENALGIKARQAYNYINAVENLSEEFLQSNATIGITKLSLLANISEDTREEIIETEVIENISVRELKERIRELEEEKEHQLAFYENDEVEELKSEFQKLSNEVKHYEKQLFNSQNEKKQLESKIQELNDSLNNVEKYNNQEEEQEIYDCNTNEEIQIKHDEELQAKHNEELQIRENDLNLKKQEIERLKKQIAVFDQVTLKFKVKFEDLQKIGNDILVLLSEMDIDKAMRCKSAINQVVKGWNLQ